MDEKQAQKPKWLRKLEQESWQAELIISGIAIFGSLQLPDLLDGLTASCVGLFSMEANMAIYFFFVYAFIGAYILILSFVLHFVLRALWVGLIGMNSVFPGGINVEGGYYPRHFMERLRQNVDYGDGLIQQLDDLCSMMFSLCTYFVLIFVAINIDVVVLFLLWTLLSLILPVKIVTGLIMLIVVGFMISGLFISILNAKPLRETALTRRVQYPIFMFTSKAFLHVLYRPTMHLSFTFFSNLNVKRYYLFTFLFLAVALLFGMFRLSDSNVFHFVGDAPFARIYERSDRMLPENYENLRQPHHGRIFSAVIEADRISGPSMRVFVPVLNNEDAILEDICGAFEAPEELGREESRTMHRAFQLDCLAKAHRFYVNDSLYLPEIHTFYHENQGEDGLIAYLPTGHFRMGENLLRVEKLSADSSGVSRTMLVPFRFER